MPRRSVPSPTIDDAPATAPKPRRKRPAAGKTAGSPARNGTKAKAKGSRRIAIQSPLLLPAPCRLLLLTYAGPAPQIAGSTSAIDRPPTARTMEPARQAGDGAVGDNTPDGSLSRHRRTNRTKSSRHVAIPPAPQLAAAICLPPPIAADRGGTDCGAGATNAARASASGLAGAEPQVLGDVRQHQPSSAVKAPARAAETCGETRWPPAPPRWHRAHAIDRRILARTGFAAAAIGVVLLLARLSPVQPTDGIIKHDFAPAVAVLGRDRGQDASQDIGQSVERDSGQTIDQEIAHDIAHDIGQNTDQDTETPQGAAISPVAQRTPSTPASAPTEVRLTEVTSLAGLSGIQPFTVAFSDRPNSDAADPATGLIAFDNWAATKPVQKRFLSPFPDYLEKTLPTATDGGKEPSVEKLHMYVAEARFVITKPPQAIDLSQYVNIGYLEGIDAAIKHRPIKPDEADNGANSNPARRWCEPQAGVLCVESRYQLEGKLPSAIRLLNQISNGKKVADYLEFQSELRVVPAAEVDQKASAKLTGLDTPVTGVLEETIFHVNQIMQFGKFLVLLQRDAADPDRTVATAFIALALKTRLIEKQKRFEGVPVLHNLVPAQLLTGRSSFNTGTSISAGLPLYARSNIKAVAAALERE